jgi:hypothetical protein
VRLDELNGSVNDVEMLRGVGHEIRSGDEALSRSSAVQASDTKLKP